MMEKKVLNLATAATFYRLKSFFFENQVLEERLSTCFAQF